MLIHVVIILLLNLYQNNQILVPFQSIVLMTKSVLTQNNADCTLNCDFNFELNQMNENIENDFMEISPFINNCNISTKYNEKYQN